MKSYQDLDVWKKAMDLADRLYDITSSFPKEERYGLASQLTRAGVSLPSNIAEGSNRPGTKDFIRFLGISLGSVAEIETQLLIAGRRNFLPMEERDKLLEECSSIGRMLRGLQRSLTQKLTSTSTSTST